MFAQYNPKKIAGSWNGIPFVGFMDGTFVSVEADEDAAMKHVGAQGHATVAINANKGAKITVTFSQNAPVNAALSALLPDADRNRLPSGPLLLKDLNGTTVVFAETAWILKVANVTFGKEIEGREWTFDCEAATIVAGGGV
jgi:hypothetical protein